MTLAVPNRMIVTDSGDARQDMFLWMNTLSAQALTVGTGSPEGIVEAGQGGEYMDDAGTTGNIKYIKRDADIGGDKSQGWILV